MCRYLVVETHPDGPPFGLLDAYGQYHLARALSRRPLVQAVLHGAQPHLGLHFLAAAGSGLRYSAAFEHVRVGRQEMEDRLRGWLVDARQGMTPIPTGPQQPGPSDRCTA